MATTLRQVACAMRGRAEFVLASTIVVWLAATVALAVWIASMIVPDPASHRAEDAQLAVVVLSPQLLAALLGLVTLAGLLVGTPWAGGVGLIWAISEVVLAAAASSRLLGLTLSVVTEGRRIFWDPSESALVFTTVNGADYTHWEDFLAVALLVAALVGLAAAIVVATGPRRRADGDRSMREP
jgi:hypothetical protein